MTLAEQIVSDLLRKLGYRVPTKHSGYEAMVDITQMHIDANMDIMKSLAERAVNPSPLAIREKRRGFFWRNSCTR